MHVPHVRMPVSGAESWSGRRRRLPACRYRAAWPIWLRWSARRTRSGLCGEPEAVVRVLGPGRGGLGPAPVRRRGPFCFLAAGAGARTWSCSKRCRAPSAPARSTVIWPGCSVSTTTRPGAGPAWPLTWLLGGGSKQGFLLKPFLHHVSKAKALADTADAS